MFLAAVLCFDKYQKGIQNLVGFNSFKAFCNFCEKLLLSSLTGV